METRARNLRVKTFLGATPAAIDAAYEAWRAGRKEEVIRDVRVASDGTNIITQVYYTEG